MILSLVVLLLTGTVCPLIGLFVYRRARNRRNRLFLAFNLNIAAWALLMLGVLFSWRTPERMALWIRFSTAVSLFIPVNLYHFVTAVTGTRARRRLELAAWFTITFTGAALAFHRSFLRAAFFYEGGDNPVFSSPEAAYGRLFIFHAVLIVLLLGRAVGHLWRSRAAAAGRSRAERDYILLGMLIGGGFAVLTGVVSPFLGTSRTTPLGPFSAVLMSAVIAYGIARHRILDVGFALSRATVYSLLTVSLALVFYLVVVLYNWTFGQFLPADSTVAPLLAALAVAFALAPLRERLQQLLDRLHVRAGVRPEIALARLGEQLRARGDLAGKLNCCLEMIVDFCALEGAVLLLRRGGERGFSPPAAAVGGLAAPAAEAVAGLAACRPLLDGLSAGDIFVREEWERRSEEPGAARVLAALAPLDAAAILPLVDGSELLGVFLLGAKRNRRMFAARDFAFGRGAASQLAILVRNEQLFARLRRAERLVAVGTLAAGLAHEIRNPLVSIKTFVQLLPEKFNDHEYRRTFSRIASQEVDRINALVGDLLRLARPSTAARGPVDLAAIIDRSLFLLQNELDGVGITVVRQLPPGPLSVVGDGPALQRLFTNLFLNAVQAMGPGGRLAVSAAAAPGRQGWFVLRVADTGGGIDPASISRVFDPFFSGRADGSGLGLALVHAIVDEHGGEISVDSEPGRGTVFTILLPAMPPAPPDA